MASVASTITWLFLEHFKDYDSWPWGRFNSVERQLNEHPSFVVGELLFLCLSLLSLHHAFCTPDGQDGRRLRLMWVATFIVGTVNDYIFMLLPVVDNFWQAQAVIMLTPRMPLYIPCIYNSFMYWSSLVAARIFHHSRRSHIGEACLAGLAAGVFYAPYDLCGARFLWWTWHDSDPGVKLRWLGVPAGSTAWVITFTFCFSFLLRKGHVWHWSQFCTLCLACLSTPLMIVMLNVYTCMGMDKIGMPGNGTLVALILTFGGVVIFQLLKVSKTQPPSALTTPEPKLIRWSIVAYFVVLVAVMAAFSPEHQISTGAHQEFGPCNVTDVDLLGFQRFRYICAERYPEFYFGFDCPRAPAGAEGRWRRLTPEAAVEEARATGRPSTASWYTVCGRPHQNFHLWFAACAALAASGASLFTWGLNTAASGKPGVMAAANKPVIVAVAADGQGSVVRRVSHTIDAD